jgi:hypothetical protein
MHRAFKTALRLYDVAEPTDLAVARVRIGAFSESELDLACSADRWALD